MESAIRIYAWNLRYAKILAWNATYLKDGRNSSNGVVREIRDCRIPIQTTTHR